MKYIFMKSDLNSPVSRGWMIRWCSLTFPRCIIITGGRWRGDWVWHLQCLFTPNSISTVREAHAPIPSSGGHAVNPIRPVSWDWMNVKICHLSKQYLYFYYEVNFLTIHSLAPSSGRFCNMTRKRATRTERKWTAKNYEYKSIFCRCTILEQITSLFSLN